MKLCLQGWEVNTEFVLDIDPLGFLTSRPCQESEQQAEGR